MLDGLQRAEGQQVISREERELHSFAGASGFLIGCGEVRDASKGQVSLSFRAVVTDIRLESRIDGISRWQMALDTTLFSEKMPVGVLIAVAPSGARLEVPVLDVFEEAGVLWHVVDKPLTEGTEISGQTL